jgi:hypothetical protein
MARGSRCATSDIELRASRVSKAITAWDSRPARGGEVGFVLQVIVAIGQTEAGLQNDGDDLHAVGEVLHLAQLQRRGHANQLQTGELRLQSVEIGNGCDTLEFGLQRSDAGRFDGALVHPAAIEVGYFALHAAIDRGGTRAAGIIRGDRGDQIADQTFVPIRKKGIDAPIGTVGGHGIGFYPAPIGKAEEVRCRRHRVVQPFGILAIRAGQPVAAGSVLCRGDRCAGDAGRRRQD